MRATSLALVIAVTAVLTVAALTLVAFGAMAKEFFTRPNAVASYTSPAPAARGGVPAHERARLATNCLRGVRDGPDVAVPLVACFLGNKDLLTETACLERLSQFGVAMSTGGTVTCPAPSY